MSSESFFLASSINVACSKHLFDLSTSPNTPDRTSEVPGSRPPALASPRSSTRTGACTTPCAGAPPPASSVAHAPASADSACPGRSGLASITGHRRATYPGF
jgi:hypothetical protein